MFNHSFTLFVNYFITVVYIRTASNYCSITQEFNVQLYFTLHFQAYLLWLGINYNLKPADGMFLLFTILL